MSRLVLGDGFFMVTVLTGRLGVSVNIVKGGASVTGILQGSVLHRHVHVGDVIATVNGAQVDSLEDLKTRGIDQPRTLCIIKGGHLVGIATKRRAQNALRHLGSCREQLREIGAVGNTPAAEKKREMLLAELLVLRHDKDAATASFGRDKHKVICIPTKRKEIKLHSSLESELDAEQRNNLSFHELNEKHGTMDKFLRAWSSYCDGTPADAASMILYYLATHYPSLYVKNVKMKNPDGDKDELATKCLEVIGRRKSALGIPLDFASHDGSSDIVWNTRFSELLAYKEQFGDCKVPIAQSPLGKWVHNLRLLKKDSANKRPLTLKRFELLDDIGFAWNALKEGQPQPIAGGNPQRNKAIAAKIVYPQLTIRECLHLAGFEDDELNVIQNEKHSWRTNYVRHRYKMVEKIKKYDTAATCRNKTSWVEIQQCVDLLREGEGDEEEEGWRQVFGERSDLLPVFLAAADERASRGIFEKPIQASAKRTSDDLHEEAHLLPVNEQLQMEVTEDPLEDASLDNE